MNRPELRSKPAARSKRRVFAVPAVIAVISLAGLVTALAGDGWRDIAAWVALAIPVAAVIFAWKRRR